MGKNLFNYKLVKILLIISSSVLAVFVVTGVVVLIGIINQFKNIPQSTTNTDISQTNQQLSENTTEEDVVKNTTEQIAEPIFIDFQPTVDSWVNSVGGNKSVYIYDLDLDKVAGQYNVDQLFDIASLYKLFVTYETYRRIENGTWSLNDSIIGMTRLDCLKLMIKESHSPCAETLWSQIGHAEMDQIIVNDYGIKDTRISGITTNIQSIAEIMKLFYHHPHFNDEFLVATMKDSFLNQPITEYDWRGGLPSGFSSKVNVYDKVGWDWTGTYWRVYNDATIVEFPAENRHFVVVVLSGKISHKDIGRFGTMLETTFYANNPQPSQAPQASRVSEQTSAL